MSQPIPTFQALDLSYDLIAALPGVLKAVARHDKPLADQLRRAAQSVALNLAESTGHEAGNRRQRIQSAWGRHPCSRTETTLSWNRAAPRTSSAPPCPFPLRTGSAQETKAALHVARNWRYVDDAAVTRAFDLADTVAKLCWRLTR